MGLHIGSTAPDFSAPTTHGPIRFHDWAGSDWVMFFSHPKDFTPVCTTELGTVARLKEQLAARGAKALAISVDAVADHERWLGDIEETQGVAVNFPVVGDPERTVAALYDMIPPAAANTLTVRSVFFIDPKKTIRAIITYPASTGRNFDEILRVLDSLQLTDHHQVATPANWKDGEEVVIVPSITDPAEIARKFPKGHRELKPYLRMTPQPNR
ncbi:MAG: peroxiredoxin [Alphaproteobacteria bacterium]|nr:peroxiredoxin [Alphaproteobacteria bacterium]